MNLDEHIQALRDAGCKEETIRSVLICFEKGETAKAQQLLTRHRKELLEGIHEGERKIGCLDYLLYQINRGA